MPRSDTGGPVADGPVRVWVRVRDAGERREAEEAGALAIDGQSDEMPGFGRVAVLGEGELLDPGRAAYGARAVLLDVSPRRLLDRFTFADLMRFSKDCRASGLAFGFGGALEAPDFPRLLPLGPAFLAVDDSVRDAAGRMDAGRIRTLVALARPTAPTENHSRPDRVFIRDLVQEMEVGAYASERGRSQRVRFSIEASLAPVTGPRTLGDIYSYDRMMDAVRALGERTPEPFVETLAEILAADILDDPRVQSVSVRVEKLDLGPASAGVEIVRTRT